MECTVRWVGANAGMSFIGASGSGHAVVMDGAPEAGGRNLGPRPMEMLLMGTGGCSAFDVVLILQRARQKVSDCQVQLRATRAETDPKVFTDIHFHFVVSGQDLSAAAQNILLEAVEIGLGAVWLGIAPEIDRMEYIKKLFNLPNNVEVFGIIAVGYPEKEGANIFVDRYDIF